MKRTHIHETYWMAVWHKYRRHRLGMAALAVVFLFVLMAVYAPFLASDKPIFVEYENEWYLPLFRYLFNTNFYTKQIDLFFNVLIVTFPFFLFSIWIYFKSPSIGKYMFATICIVQLVLFGYFAYRTPEDPESDPVLAREEQEVIQTEMINHRFTSLATDWNFELQHMTPYRKLNLLLYYRNTKLQELALQPYEKQYLIKYPDRIPPTLWQMDKAHVEESIEILQKQLIPNNPSYNQTKAELDFILDREKWLREQSTQLHHVIMPLLRPFHWEQDAGGGQEFNKYIPWWEVTRINRKDLTSALIFGTRISLVVGIASITIALLIAIPIGAFAGYYGGKLDILVCRLLEIWEGMPVFFMLLMVIALLQSKSVFLVIAAIGFFGWTGFSRYIRGEFFKQRNLPYVESCHALGFRDSHIMFSHLLPNAIPPVLTLIPFAVMGAITTEAGLSFLGLGEEGSCSWGVLMDEGRTAFPVESYLLWPPALMLTVLLIVIALVGDTLRDILDPKVVAQTQLQVIEIEEPRP